MVVYDAVLSEKEHATIIDAPSWRNGSKVTDNKVECKILNKDWLVSIFIDRNIIFEVWLMWLIQIMAWRWISGKPTSKPLVTQFNAVYTVCPKKYAHGFVVLCFVVVMQSFIMNSHEVFIHIHQGCFAGTGAIVRLPQCQWSKPDGYGNISQCITTTKHSKAKTVCIFLGIYCMLYRWRWVNQLIAE